MCQQLVSWFFLSSPSPFISSMVDTPTSYAPSVHAESTFCFVLSPLCVVVLTLLFGWYLLHLNYYSTGDETCLDPQPPAVSSFYVFLFYTFMFYLNGWHLVGFVCLVDTFYLWISLWVYTLYSLTLYYMVETYYLSFTLFFFCRVLGTFFLLTVDLRAN